MSGLARCAVALVAAAIGLVLATPAFGAVQDEPECGSLCGGGGVDPDSNEAWSEATGFLPGDEGGAFYYPTGSSYLDECNWQLAPAGTTEVLHPIAGAWEVDFDEDHYLVWCAPFTIVYTFFPVGDPPPAPIIDDMIADAYARTPVAAFNPITSPDGDDDITLITQMTTFLWVDQEAWTTEVSATAAVPGFSVTTSALPYHTRWSGGDEPTDCRGDQMHPYVFGIGGDESQPSDCTMVYRRSSALQDNIVELEVDWTVNLTCSIPVCGGPLPDITTTSQREVIVGEIQSVER